MRRERAESRALMLHIGGVTLDAELILPEDAHGLVVFASGSGSSRHGPRHLHMAHALAEAGLGTVLFDLLTHEEEQARAHDPCFEVALLAGRLGAVLDRLHAWAETRALPLGLFGAGTGAAAALVAAARRPDLVAAVVSRAGRPELAPGALDGVRAPTLLIAGALDEETLAQNRAAARQLERGELAIVPGATHHFDEKGTLEEAARLARDFFVRHMLASAARPDGDVVRLPFADRRAAGRQLAEWLRRQVGEPGTIVLGLARGGVPVAHEVARALALPEDVLVVRKLRAPFQPELAMGALAPGIAVLEPEVVRAVAERDVQEAIAREEHELRALERRFRTGRPPLDVRCRTVVLVDDGLATGATMRAALSWAHTHRAARVIVALPVGSPDAIERLAPKADEVVCLATPVRPGAPGSRYRHFDPVGDDEIVRLLAAAPGEATPAGMSS